MILWSNPQPLFLWEIDNTDFILAHLIYNEKVANINVPITFHSRDLVIIFQLCITHVIFIEVILFYIVPLSLYEKLYPNGKREVITSTYNLNISRVFCIQPLLGWFIMHHTSPQHDSSISVSPHIIVNGVGSIKLCSHAH